MKMATANYHDLLLTETLEYVCRETLNRTRDILEEDFDPLLVQNDLLQNGILTENECEELKRNTRRRDRLKFFLTLLENRHKTFHKFVDVLKNFKGYEALGSNLADQSLELKLYVEEVKELHNLFRGDRYSEEDQAYMIDALMNINKADAMTMLDNLKLNRHSIQLNNCNGLGFRPTFAKILHENNMACPQFRTAFSALTQSMSISTTKSSNEVGETDERHPFDFYDMMENAIKELTLSSIENMCEYLNMSKSMRSITKSETPGRQFFIECRRQNIISRYDTQRLVEAAHKCGLKTVEEIIEDYQRISCCPEIRVTLTCGSSSEATSNNFRDFLLNKKRELKAMFRRNHGAHFVDSEEGSIVVRLKVTNALELERLIEDIKSGKVLESIKELFHNEVSENEMENVFGRVETVKITINETDIINAELHFSSGSSFRHSHSVSKSTETQTTTTVITDIRQRALQSVITELEEEFDPISLLPMLEKGDFFNEGEKDRLLRTSTRADRVRLFQSYLLSKPYSNFNEFVNALSGCGHYMSLVKTLRRNLLEIKEKTEYIHTTVTNTEIGEESSSHIFSIKTFSNTAKTDDVKLESKTLETGTRGIVTSVVPKRKEANKSSHGTRRIVTGADPKRKEANKSSYDTSMDFFSSKMSPTAEMYPYLTQEEFESYQEEGTKTLNIINSFKKKEYEERIMNYSLKRHQKPGMSSQDGENLQIAILGKTGDGKSSTANSILGRDSFETGQSSNSLTKFSSEESCTYGERTLTVVDTPGVHDTEHDVSTTMREIIRWAFLLRRGAHCFIICMNASDPRFRKETQEFLKLITEKEENCFYNYCIVVYTNPESALNHCSLDKFIDCKKDNQLYKRFMDAIGNRVVAVNNTSKIPVEQQRNRDAIIAMADKVVNENKKRQLKELYTNKVIEQAEELHNKIATVVKSNDCHPILVSATVESYINCFEKIKVLNIFKEKALEALMKRKECKLDDNTKDLVLNYDGKEVVIIRDIYEKQIHLIHDEMKSEFSFFSNILRSIISDRSGIVLTVAGLVLTIMLRLR